MAIFNRIGSYIRIQVMNVMILDTICECFKQERYL